MFSMYLAACTCDVRVHREVHFSWWLLQIHSVMSWYFTTGHLTTEER